MELLDAVDTELILLNGYISSQTAPVDSLRKGGMGGIIGFGFRYIKYLMCIQSEPKRSVSLAVHTLFIT